MNDDNDLTLRDKLAMEILNGLLSANKDMAIDAASKDQYSNHVASEKLSQLIRVAYQGADLARKIRLTAFE